MDALEVLESVVYPAEFTIPADPADPADPAEFTIPADPADPVDPAEFTIPADCVVPAVCVDVFAKSAAAMPENSTAIRANMANPKINIFFMFLPLLIIITVSQQTIKTYLISSCHSGYFKKKDIIIFIGFKNPNF
ncbi:MAG: hypothetical protein EHM14_09425 [Methanothrix sp.]|nr:MAG: hypothetical protein EHM14_09425 [Methanothrix sp.]